MQYPVEQGEGFHRIIDLLKMTMYVFTNEGGKPEKHPIPESEKARAEALHKELVEKAAENDETLMEHYFEKGELSEDEMRQGLKIGMMQRTVYPVFCLSALRNMGSGRLMGFIDNVRSVRHRNAPGTLGRWRYAPLFRRRFTGPVHLQDHERTPHRLDHLLQGDERRGEGRHRTGERQHRRSGTHRPVVHRGRQGAETRRTTRSR